MNLADRLSARSKRPDEKSPDPKAPASTPAEPSVPAAPRTFQSRVTTTAPPGRRRAPADPFLEIKQRVHDALLELLGPSLYDAKMGEAELDSRVRQTLGQVISAQDTLLSTAERQQIQKEISDEILGYGPLEPLLQNPEVTEIMVVGPDRVFVEMSGQIHNTDVTFADERHLRRTLDKIVGRVGRRIDESSPMVDARLTDGSRVNAVIAPIALDGSMLTIRKFAADPFGVADLINFGTVSEDVAVLLEACVQGRLNILISGGTGSGKTTTLNVVSSFLSSDERIVTIEDAAELQLFQDHVARMETRPSNIEGRGEVTARDLVRNALRMRPDRIIVGEVRDGAALDMLQAMNTGHDGSLTTLHANSPRDALSRIETMVLMAGMELPARAIREQVASALDLIVHQARLRDGSRRITHITEVTHMEGEVITLQDIFVFDFHAGVDEHGRYLGSLKSTGIRPAFLDKLQDQGIYPAPDLFDGQV
jgi:pilus assembly protein CpaF